jgi:hypothetical protein
MRDANNLPSSSMEEGSGMVVRAPRVTQKAREAERVENHRHKRLIHTPQRPHHHPRPSSIEEEGRRHARLFAPRLPKDPR